MKIVKIESEVSFDPDNFVRFEMVIVSLG